MKSIAGRFQMLSRVLAIMVTPVCIAQVPAFDIDRISNWPAPLYWQSATTHSPLDEHHGRIREEASVKQAAATTLGQPAVFVAMTPCRVVDTRAGSLPFGGPAFAASEQRTIPMPA